MESDSHSTTELIAKAATWNETLPALLAPGRGPLSFQQLLDMVRAAANDLNLFGVRRGDRIAIVMPNGPEAVTSFLSVAAIATAAPLNPAYAASEFDFYLEDLKPKGVIVAAGFDSPVRDVAIARGIDVIELAPVLNGPAGRFTLTRPSRTAPSAPQLPIAFAEPDDVALVLHTSGTTSRPKIVPLTQANLCVSASNIARTLKLSSPDRVLNVMPLFHIHGLIAATLAPLSAGGSVVCSPGFFAPQFFGWLDEFQPTWYSAVPTMHQAILSRAASERVTMGRAPLRFIRSSSAALPPQVLHELERTFGVPVVEAYGMTEAAHQMASNPLPPRQRKPGSVGLAAGPEVSIMDAAGQHLLSGERGEIVIRGKNVTKGYEGNPAANADAFTDGWFRTGDQGYLDVEGYLYITGRLKEQINRGGEKISPREIDEVLLDHPAIAQAVTFAMPHATLGEDVAAAVVLRKGETATESSIQQFASSRMSHFKVPRRVVILDEIPKGATGKVQRIGLAARLGLATTHEPAAAERAPHVPPQTPMEIALTEIWEQLLNVTPIGINDDFLQLGGDSILGTQLMARVHEAFGVELHLITLFESSTVANLATMILAMQMATADPDFLLFPGSDDTVIRDERKTA